MVVTCPKMNSVNKSSDNRSTCRQHVMKMIVHVYVSDKLMKRMYLLVFSAANRRLLE